MDQESNPISDVNMVLMPSMSGTKTNFSGEYHLSPDTSDSLLIISHIGYKTDTLALQFFTPEMVIVLERKILLLDPLNVMGQSRAQFDEFQTKNTVTSIAVESIPVRGHTDIGDALFSEQPVVMHEELSGRKTLSVRASSSEEMVYLYDGIRINTMSDPMVDVSIFSPSGIAGIEIVRGNHEKAMTASGIINFIPKLTYGPSATFYQQFGTYNYGGFDGFGSFGNSNYSLNAGTGESQYNQFYIDAESPEITTNQRRQFFHGGLKKGPALEFRGMVFRNERHFENTRLDHTLDVDWKNAIAKVIHANQKGQLYSVYGLIQTRIGDEVSGIRSRVQEGENTGLGLTAEVPVQNASLKFQAESSSLHADWTTNDRKYIVDRNLVLLSGAMEIIQPATQNELQLKDARIVFSRQITSDSPQNKSNLFLSNSWEESSLLFNASVLGNLGNQRILVFTNSGQAYRFPSVNEILLNHEYEAEGDSIPLEPERKATFEIGFKLEKRKSDHAAHASISLSFFNYHYSNKIKNIHFSGSPIELPINYGDASLTGLETMFEILPFHDVFHFTSSYALYQFSDPFAFQLQPKSLLRNNVTIQVKGISLGVSFRNEGARELTTTDIFGNQFQNHLKPIQNWDVSASYQLNFKDVQMSLGLAGKNMKNQTTELSGISIYDRRIQLSVQFSWK